MLPIRWTDHALRNLLDRAINRADAETALRNPECEEPDPPGRRVLMRRFWDKDINRRMLLRVVVEDESHEVVVITVCQTSQIQRYMKGRAP